jgi:hypothetical protein
MAEHAAKAQGDIGNIVNRRKRVFSPVVDPLDSLSDKSISKRGNGVPMNYSMCCV